jgi:hypothetical protein
MAAVRLLLITLEIPARRMNLFFDAQDAIPARFAHAQGGSAAHQCIGIKASAFDGLRERDRESIPLAAQSSAQFSQRAAVSDEFQFSLGARSCLRVHSIQSSVPDGLTYRNARRRLAAMMRK